MKTALFLFPYTYIMIHVYEQNSTPFTGWRKHIGCLELQVIFCQRATNYRAFLRTNETRHVYKTPTGEATIAARTP